MARINVAPRVKCDRCGVMFAEDSHHARMHLFVGFGDLREARGRLVTALDLCDACARKVEKLAKEPGEGYQEKLDY